MSDNGIEVGGLMPIANIHPVIKKKILGVLKKYSFEDQLYALILWKMIKQLDEPTQRLKYVQRNLKALSKINMATRYVQGIIDASNRVWLESFKERDNDISIAGFCKAIVFRKPKMFKNMGVRIDDLIKLDKLHGSREHLMPTLKIISLMFEKTDKEIEINDEEVIKYFAKKNKD